MNEIVAIGPDVIPDPILIMTMRFGIVNEIHPVSGLPFAEAGIIEKAINDTFISNGRIVGEEGREFSGSGGHADEVDSDATEEGAFVGGRSVSESAFAVFFIDEEVDGIVRPLRVC